MRIILSITFNKPIHLYQVTNCIHIVSMLYDQSFLITYNIAVLEILLAYEKAGSSMYSCASGKGYSKEF